jgi:hypothetical protein
MIKTTILFISSLQGWKRDECWVCHDVWRSKAKVVERHQFKQWEKEVDTIVSVASVGN